MLTYRYSSCRYPTMATYEAQWVGLMCFSWGFIQRCSSCVDQADWLTQWGLVGNISNSYWVSNARKSPKKHKSPWFWIFTYVTEATLILSGSRNTAKMVPVVGGFKGCGREQCWWIWFGPSWCERYIKWKRVMCPCLRRTNSCRREKGEICLIQL